MTPDSLVFQQLTSPGDASPELRRALAECWVEVTNAGGAAGFPFPPVDAATVTPALDRIVDQLAPDTNRILTATMNGDPSAHRDDQDVGGQGAQQLAHVTSHRGDEHLKRSSTSSRRTGTSLPAPLRTAPATSPALALFAGCDGGCTRVWESPDSTVG